MASGLKVTAPATLSNLNCGFDTLGLATEIISDEMIGRRCNEPGVHILNIIGPGKKGISLRPEENTAGVAVGHFFRYTGIQDSGIEIEIHKHTPAGSGLGSSASSACAAVVLANALFEYPLRLEELTPLAILGEYISGHAYHSDNVAPCMLGGIVLTRDLRQLDFQKLNVPPGLAITVVQPDFAILTSASRKVLSPTVPLKKMVKQQANLASLVLALERSDYDLLGRSLQDHIIEPQRAHLIPGFDDMKEAAYKAGALAFGISGSGPALFAFSQNTLAAEEIGMAMHDIFRKHSIEAVSHVTKVSRRGTEVQ